jgi:hypothetical protein
MVRISIAFWFEFTGFAIKILASWHAFVKHNLTKMTGRA